ncbi:PREDICTED: micronuclear linker histone polyprotein-like [Trachymyrmex cornetzi]|nr:PREDICTED: micronuclear linker histone polyprotein-like [Trachymyrmex cornetzi]
MAGLARAIALEEKMRRRCERRVVHKEYKERFSSPYDPYYYYYKEEEKITSTVEEMRSFHRWVIRQFAGQSMANGVDIGTASKILYPTRYTQVSEASSEGDAKQPDTLRIRGRTKGSSAGTSSTEPSGPSDTGDRPRSRPGPKCSKADARPLSRPSSSRKRTKKLQRQQATSTSPEEGSKKKAREADLPSDGSVTGMDSDDLSTASRGSAGVSGRIRSLEQRPAGGSAPHSAAGSVPASVAVSSDEDARVVSGGPVAPPSNRRKRGRPPTTGEYVARSEALRRSNEEDEKSLTLARDRLYRELDGDKLLSSAKIDLEKWKEDLSERPDEELSERIYKGQMEVIWVVKASGNLKGTFQCALKVAATSNVDAGMREDTEGKSRKIPGRHGIYGDPVPQA